MNPLWRHIIASFTAAATLLTSVTCMCQGAIFPSSEVCCHTSESAHDPCCRDDDHDDHDTYARDVNVHDHDSKLAGLCDQISVKEQERSCNHCRSSLAIESVGAGGFAHLFHLTLCILDFELQPVVDFARPAVRAQHFGDDPLPSSCASTLLRQHCALNT